MNKIFFRKTLVYITTLTIILAVFPSLMLNTIAEDPPDPPAEDPQFLGDGWFVDAIGTYFEITNSSYLNITLTSTENIHVVLESVQKIISYHIENNCTANSTSILLSGFEPNKIYYMYQDDNQEVAFTTDQNGSYCYIQDLTTHHFVSIQEETSTIYIYASGTIVPSTAPISKDPTNTYYTLTGNINEGIRIYRSGITLDGNGFTVQKTPIYGYTGIFLSSRFGITIKDLSIVGFQTGIFLSYCNDITITNCIFSSNTHSGIRAVNSNSVTVTNSLISNNLGYYGISLSYDNDFILSGCTISDNSYPCTGLQAWKCSGTIITGNTVSNNGYVGLNIRETWGTTGVTISGNTISGNARSGIAFWNHNDGTITGNTISNNNNHGIWLSGNIGSLNALITDNIIIDNTPSYGIYIRSSTAEITSNTISNNYYGIYQYYPPDSTTSITGNLISLSSKGISTYYSSATITGNTIANNDWGISLYRERYTGFEIYHNNLIDNTYQAYAYSTPLTVWDNGAGEGNYWSDYTGLDNGAGGRIPGDGVGDTNIPHLNLDWYPLMDPWSDNDPPVANAGGPYVDYEGNEITFDASGSTDPDNDPLEYRWDFNNDGTWDTPYSTVHTATNTWYDDHSGISTVEVWDGEYTDTAETTVTVNNVAPTADAGEDKTGDEPSTFTFTGSHTDPGTLDTHTYEWDFSYDGITFNSEATGNNIPQTWLDDFDGNVALRVTDDDGDWHIDTCHVTVNNVAPTIQTLTLTLDPVQLGTPVDLTATFTDLGVLDTHTATTIDWGDGNTSSGTITGSGGTYTVTDSWTYGQTGVYTITLTVEDDDGGSDTTIFQYVVIYDPNDGFVTGGGWINSPVGAYIPDPDLTGKANFGFVAKYKKGQTTPDGNTEFNFKVADMNFHSNDYEWLVIIIAGAKAIYKGTGTINGAGNYGFKLFAIDEDLTPSTDYDLFRIKIWDKDNNDEVIYDNELGEDEDVDPTTQISGGSIKIHKG